MYIRKGWGAQHQRSDTRVREEVFPDLLAFGARPEELANPPEDPKVLREMSEQQLRGRKFKVAEEMLRSTHRTALAHAGKVDVGKPLTGASFDDYMTVADKVPVVRYMANVVLENLRATFDTEGKCESSETI